jgi:DNA replication protein DnaC
MISLIITILFVVSIACFSYFLYLKYSAKYTRERFAFLGVTTMTTLTANFFLQINSSQSYYSAFINTSNFVFKTKIASYQPHLSDHLLVLVMLIFLMYFITNLHKNWNGPISEISYHKLRFNENSTIVNEAMLQLKDFISKDKAIVIHKENDNKNQGTIFNPYVEDKMPWYENVHELLKLSSYQYKIDLNKDYYHEEKCFISKYGLNDELTAILCTIEYPKISTIRKFINFTKSQKKEITKHIIAVKNFDSKETTIKEYDTNIVIRNENEMLNSLIDFSSYHQFIKDQFTNKQITVNSSKTLYDIYVKLNGKDDKGDSVGEIENYVFNWLNIDHDNKHLALLGEYGCGKSVLSTKIAYELLEKRTNISRIPILIELRGRSPRNQSITDILSAWAYDFRIDPYALLKLHKAGRLLIIFEGFDEMDMIGDREVRLNHFQRLWEFAIYKSKIIITGRPNFFLDDRELKMDLGIDKPFETSPYCEAIYLEKFDIVQIETALRSIDSNTREQVLDILHKKDNTNFYDLVSRPAILFLVAVIWKERKLAKLKDNINSAVVISEFIKYSYSRQEGKNANFPLSEKEREYFMLGIAVGMHFLTGFSNQISKVDMEIIILDLYKFFPNEITAIENAIQNKRKSLKERMLDNNKAEETILTDVRSCGIVVNELSRKDYFKFAHKSFLEYQISLFFVESLLQDRKEYNLMMNAISRALDIDLAIFRHSEETISFTSEILISKLQLNKMDDQIVVCRRLFRLLYPNKLLSNYPRLITAIEMYSKSSFIAPFVLFPAMILAFFSSRFMKTADHDNYFFYLVVLTTFPIVLSAFFTVFTSRARLYGRTFIWLKCCQQLNIPEKIINKVVSKKYVNYLEGEKIKNPMIEIIKKLRSLSIVLRKPKVD